MGLTGLILAGGYSRRFGADKAHFSVGGRTMIEIVADAVASVCDSVFVSLGVDTAAFELPGHPTAKQVRDRFERAGPLAGIHAGFEAADTSWMLVVACDMPFMSTGALQMLLERRTSASQVVVAADSGGRLHPLCACYRRDTLPLMLNQLTSGHRSLHNFLDRIDQTVIVRLPDRALRNINAPSDLADIAPENR